MKKFFWAQFRIQTDKTRDEVSVGEMVDCKGDAISDIFAEWINYKKAQIVDEFKVSITELILMNCGVV